MNTAGTHSSVFSICCPSRSSSKSHKFTPSAGRRAHPLRGAHSRVNALRAVGDLGRIDDGDDGTAATASPQPYELGGAMATPTRLLAQSELTTPSLGSGRRDGGAAAGYALPHSTAGSPSSGVTGVGTPPVMASSMFGAAASTATAGATGAGATGAGATGGAGGGAGGGAIGGPSGRSYSFLGSPPSAMSTTSWAGAVLAAGTRTAASAVASTSSVKKRD